MKALIAFQSEPAGKPTVTLKILWLATAIDADKAGSNLTSATEADATTAVTLAVVSFTVPVLRVSHGVSCRVHKQLSQVQLKVRVCNSQQF